MLPITIGHIPWLMIKRLLKEGVIFELRCYNSPFIGHLAPHQKFPDRADVKKDDWTLANHQPL